MVSVCFAVVVVYNKSIQDSLTCSRLMGIDNPILQVVIYDNSTEDYNNRLYSEQQGWKYLGGEGNNGLSVAYNRSIEYIKKIGEIGWVCLFDDDTNINAEYFEELTDYAQRNTCEVIVPLIYSADVLLSPSKINRRNHKIKLFSSESEAIAYRGTDITAINSGMAIRTEVFEWYHYDEKIFLDGIDHKFVGDMVMHGSTIGVMPYSCQHEFSGNSRSTVKSARSRFAIFVKDMQYLHRNNKRIFWRIVGKRTLKLVITYRTFEFVRTLFSNLKRNGNKNEKNQVL